MFEVRSGLRRTFWPLNRAAAYLLPRWRTRSRRSRPEPTPRDRLRPSLTDGNGPARSAFEQQFRRAVARSDLPPAQFNVSLGGMEVDVLWPSAPLVVELDGRAYHSDPAAFERDRERDARLGALHQVIRITWRPWRDQPDVELRAGTRSSSSGRGPSMPAGDRYLPQKRGQRSMTYVSAARFRTVGTPSPVLESCRLGLRRNREHIGPDHHSGRRSAPPDRLPRP